MKGKVLMFHRVLPEGEIQHPNAYWDRGTLVSQSFFADLLDRLQANQWQFFNLLTFLERNQTGEATTKDVVLTFDDGYEDNYRIVFPMLKKRGIPGSFYPVVQPVISRKALVLDRYYTALDQIRMPHDERMDWISGKKKEQFLGADPIQKEWIISHLQERSGGSKGGPPRFMDTQQMQKMATEGMEFGGHSMSHPRLTEVTQDQLRVELNHNMQWLRETFGDNPYPFCYPDGKYSPMVTAAVSEAGFTCAATTDNIGKGPWEIPRLFISPKFEFKLLE